MVEESQTLGDEVEFTEGLTIDRGFLSPYFISDQERSLCEFKNPKVIIRGKGVKRGLLLLRAEHERISRVEASVDV